MKKFLFCASLVFCAILGSCSKNSQKIQFDNLDPLAMEPGVEWLLVTSPYTACHSQADYGSSVEKYLRRGEIRMVQGSATVKTDEVYEKWFFVEEGWIPENCSEIYSNKLRAQTAKSALR